MLVISGIYAIVGSLLLGGTTAMIMKEEEREAKKKVKKVDNTSTKYYESQPIGKMYNIVIDESVEKNNKEVA